MKYTITLLLLCSTIFCFGQSLEQDALWRTVGVYDSLGNFVKRAKVQSFLYISESNKIHRLFNQDKINMETGETKVFVYRDTFTLASSDGNAFKINDKETLIIHSKDSIIIQFNGFNTAYVKISLPYKKKLKEEKLKNALLDKSYNETVEGETKYQLKYQKSGLVKISPIESESEWESDYKLINFNGYLIIQGIISAPKLAVRMSKNEIEFIKIDYRFKNKKCILEKSVR